MKEEADILRLGNPTGFATYSLAWGCESLGVPMTPVKITLPTEQQYMETSPCKCRTCQEDDDQIPIHLLKNWIIPSGTIWYGNSLASKGDSHK